MATERLEAELVSHAAWEAAGLARMLDVLAEFDARDGWSRWIGCVSMQQWLSWQCGLGYTAATERLRVARVLPGLPAIRRSFHDGVLSWSKVRELTRVATASDDATWADLAAKTTATQLSRLVRQQRRITAGEVLAQEQRRETTRRIDADGSMVIEIRLPIDEGALVWSAIDTAAGPPQHGVPVGQRRADATIELLLGRVEVRTEVQVHLEQCPTCQHRGASIDGIAVHPDVADAVACDAEIVTTHTPNDESIYDERIDDGVGHEHDRRRGSRRARRHIHRCGCGHDANGTAGAGAGGAGGAGEVDADAVEVGEIDRRRGPSRRQRRALRYRHPMCQFPGCHHDGRFDAHHVIAHGAGGRTRVANLVRLCRYHHRLVHLARLVLCLDADRRLTVTTPDGHPVHDQILRTALRIPAPDDPTRIGALGERMDIDACLLTIHTATRTPPDQPHDPPAAAA